jgi:hypothetical protein
MTRGAATARRSPTSSRRTTRAQRERARAAPCAGHARLRRAAVLLDGAILRELGDRAPRRAERLQSQQRAELVRARVASGEIDRRAARSCSACLSTGAERVARSPTRARYCTQCARATRRSGRPRRSRQRASCSRRPSGCFARGERRPRRRRGASVRGNSRG